MPVSESEFARSSGIDAKTRRRLMNRCRLMPVDHRNFFAKWLGDKPTSGAMSLKDGANRRWASM